MACAYVKLLMSVRLQLQMPLHPYGLYTDHHAAEKGTENTLKEEWSECTGALECHSSTCLHLQDHGSGLPPSEAPVMIAEKRNFLFSAYRIMLRPQWACQWA